MLDSSVGMILALIKLVFVTSLEELHVLLYIDLNLIILIDVTNNLQRDEHVHHSLQI